jgi:hypothetical protein
MLKCRGCGVPRLFSFSNKWTDDGILLSMPRGLLRLIMMEREHMVEIFLGIEEKLGFPIDRIIVEAKRKDAWVYVQDVMPPLLGRLLRLPPLRRLAYYAMIQQASLIGLGKVKLLEHRRGERLVGRINPVYYHALFSGDAWGAFENFEGLRASMDYVFFKDELFIFIRAAEDAPEEERLQLLEAPTLPAHAGFERCRVCGLPVEISNFRWDAKTGRMFDDRTGEWFFIQGIRALDAVLRELEFELGEEIPHLVSELTRKFFRRLKSEHPQYFSDLAFMKVRGIGVPEIASPTPEELKDGVNIRNSFNGPILAGMVAAVCGSNDPTWSWEAPSQGIIRVKVT